MVVELLPTSIGKRQWEVDLLRKTQGKMRSHDLGRKDSQRKMKEKIKGKGNLPGPAGIGVVGTAETSTVGTVETNIVGTTKTGAIGTTETGTEGAAGMGATGMAGVDIPTSVANSDPSKVSTNEEIGKQMKGSNEQYKYI